MALISKIEAAIKLGYSIELIDYFTNYCPKSGDNVKLRVVKTDIGDMYEESELINFQIYLNRPWPKTANANRPPIPEQIKNDIRKESHYSCAICGHMDNGEVAHIDAVCTTLNNSPDNLIFLCPNHHTKYDYGYKISSNITIEEVKAAKLVKRHSRCRIYRYEANATKSLLSLINALKKMQEKLENEQSQTMTDIYLTEITQLTKTIPELSKKAFQQAAKDEFDTMSERLLSQNAPNLAELIKMDVLDGNEKNIGGLVNEICKRKRLITIDIDEVECPHCKGRGLTGLVGDFCAYCGGSCVVTKKKNDAYDPDNIDEVECPHCNGYGHTGLVGNLCAYCGGSCVVTEQELEDYDLEDIDEVECPRCNGRGHTGLVGDFCAYCGGSCVVTKKEHDAYDPDGIDEVECPHCNGYGHTGLVGNLCAYCGGSCVVTEQELEDYDLEDIDEVECPRCNGRGHTGLVSDFCAYCGGSCVVTKKEHDAYDPDNIDEVECPRCNGRGHTGLVGDFCALCRGSCVVTQEIADAYRKQY